MARIDLDIRQLRAVLAVADAGGFSGAAARAGIAQSSLSRTVQEVERRVGVALFRRTTREVAATVEGRAFVELARHVVGTHDTAMAHLAGYVAGVQGHVSVAALPSLAAGLLPAALARYRRARPEVSVEVLDGLSEEVRGRVGDGSVDLGLTVGRELPAGLHATPLVRDTFHLVVPVTDPLARDDAVPWTALEGRPFVVFAPSSSIRADTDRVLAAVGVRTGPVVQARNILAVGGLVAAGLGVTAVPALVLPLIAFAGLTGVPLRAPRVQRDICMIHDPRRPLSPAARGLVELLTDGGELDLPPGAERAGDG